MSIAFLKFGTRIRLPVMHWWGLLKNQKGEITKKEWGKKVTQAEECSTVKCRLRYVVAEVVRM